MRRAPFGWIFRPRPPNQTNLSPTTSQPPDFLFRNTGDDSGDIQDQQIPTRVERTHAQSPPAGPSDQHAASTSRAAGQTELIIGPTVECVVCRNDIEENQFPQSAPCEGCTHLPEVCLECLRQTIQTAITIGEFLSGISCPSANCSEKLDYFAVEKWADKDTFERYDKLLLQNSLRTEVPSYVLCISPTCGSGQEHTGGDSNSIVTCHACGLKQCFKHQTPWHEGLTCDQWDEQIKQDAVNKDLTDELVKTTTKACPREGCGRRIEKIDGCDHMTCKPPGGCGYEFCWLCLASWKEIIRGDNSRHYDHCAYYTGIPGGNPAPSSILPEGTRPIQPPMTGGNVGVFEAIFGRPRANIHRPPVPAVPPFRDNGRVHNPWDMVLNRRAGEMQNNRVTNALEDLFIPPPPLNNRTTMPVNTLRPLRDITMREDTRVPGGISLAQALTNISPPPRENMVERRERIRRQLIRPRTTIDNGAEPNPNDNARPQIRPLLLPRRINETPQLRHPANQRLPPLPPLSPRPTGEASNYLNESNRNHPSGSALRSVLRRPPPSPGRPGLTLNNWNEVNGNPLPRTRAIHTIPSPVTSRLQNPPTINQPNEARRRRPGVAFDLSNEPEDAPMDHFWSHLGRLGEPDPVASTSRNADTRPPEPTPYAGVAFPPSPVLSGHGRNSMPIPGPSTSREEDRPMWRRSGPLPEHSLSALLDSLDSSSSGSSNSPPSIPDSLEFIANRMNREDSDPGSSTSRALPEVQPLSPFSPFLVPSPPSSPESSPLPLPGLDTMDFIPDLTEGMESVQEPSTSNGPGGFRTVPSPSALFLQGPSSSTPTRRTNYPFNSLISLGGIENSFTSSRGPQNRLRRPYEIVDDREMEPTPSNVHDVSALGPVSETSLASPQSLVPIAPQPLMSSRVVPPNHRAIRRSPSSSPVMEETLLDVFSGLSRRQIPLSQSPLAPIDDRRQPPATSPYQNLFDRLSSTSVLPTTPNRTLRMTPIEATIEMPNSLPPPLVPTPVPLHRSNIDLERRLPPLPISLDTSS